MNGCYGIVNGKNVFVDTKLIEKTVANGVAKGIVNGYGKVCCIAMVFGGLTTIGLYAYSEIVNRMNASETEDES